MNDCIDKRKLKFSTFRLFFLQKRIKKKNIKEIYYYSIIAS